MMIRRLGIVLCLALLPVLVDSCKKQEQPEARQQKRKKKTPVTQSDNPKRKALSKAERTAIAKQRLMEFMKTKKTPFDRVAAAQAVVLQKYAIDIKDVFELKELNAVKSGRDLRDLFVTLKNADAVRGILEDEAAKEVEPNWSPLRLEKVKKAADEKFKYFKLEQVIEVKIKTAGGGIRSVRGRLEAVTSKAIFVGGQRIPVADLADPPRWSFDLDAVRKRRNNYVYHGFTRPKADEKNILKEKIAPIIYKKYGCIQVKSKWMSIKRALIKEIEPMVDAMDKAHDQAEIERFQVEIYKAMKEEGLLDN